MDASLEYFFGYLKMFALHILVLKHVNQLVFHFLVCLASQHMFNMECDWLVLEYVETCGAWAALVL